MTTPCAGEIRVSHIRTELGIAGQFSLGQAEGRAFAAVPAGIIRITDYYCKSNYMYAEGGTVTQFTDGGGVTWRVHTFTSSGVLNVHRLGPHNGYVQRLVVGAGGGGGHSTQIYGSGAGGGNGAAFGGNILGTGWVHGEDWTLCTLGSNGVIVGARGGAGNSAYRRGGNGGYSQFRELVAYGGGGGGAYAVGNETATGLDGQGPRAGGGGGAEPGGSVLIINGGNGGVGGYPGGRSEVPNTAHRSNAGGGGGAGQAGAGGPARKFTSTRSWIDGGLGGNGVLSSIDGVARWYSAGGGGAGAERNTDTSTAFGNTPRGVRGEGGSGGTGGHGAQWTNYAATEPRPNSGSGGGGGGGQGTWLATQGAAGVVVIRYPISPYTPPHL